MEQRKIIEGMTVWSSDGEKLGKVVLCGAKTFLVEKGFFFPKDYTARYEDVRTVGDDDVHLSLTKTELKAGHWDEAGVSTERSADVSERPIVGATAVNAGISSNLRSGISQTNTEITVPLVEEEVIAEKHMHQEGEVRVRKEVHMEQRQITVPVMREEVIVEKVPVQARDARPGEIIQGTGEVISVPIMEEEVEIRKRAVVKEEVHISKQMIQENHVADTSVRKETAEIEGIDVTKLPKTPGGVDQPRI